MYVSRFLYQLKRMVSNKARVEGSIFEAYLLQELSTFGSHYFDADVPCRINRVPRNDDGGDIDAPENCLSIFRHPGRGNKKLRTRYLSDEEYITARKYVLLNCEEIDPYTQ